MKDVRANPAAINRVETRMTHRGPKRSYSLPTMNRASAKTAMLTKKTAETAPRLQPNSAMMGFIITPKAYRAPELKKRIPKEAATIYQP